MDGSVITTVCHNENEIDVKQLMGKVDHGNSTKYTVSRHDMQDMSHMGNKLVHKTSMPYIPSNTYSTCNILLTKEDTTSHHMGGEVKCNQLLINTSTVPIT
jgi:hypothetical protein